LLSKELLPKEIGRRLSRRLGLTLTIGLALGLLLSLGVIVLFAKIVEDVVEGESRRFDDAVQLFIHDYSLDWLYEPMLFITALGYYWESSRSWLWRRTLSTAREQESPRCCSRAPR
jgi:hypothetical protein